MIGAFLDTDVTFQAFDSAEDPRIAMIALRRYTRILWMQRQSNFVLVRDRHNAIQEIGNTRPDLFCAGAADQLFECGSIITGIMHLTAGERTAIPDGQQRIALHLLDPPAVVG